MSPTVPETMMMARMVAAVPSASPSPSAEEVVSVEWAGSAPRDVVVPVFAVDPIGTQAVSGVEGGTSVLAVTGPLGGSAVPVAVASGEADLVLVEQMRPRSFC